MTVGFRKCAGGGFKRLPGGGFKRCDCGCPNCEDIEGLPSSLTITVDGPINSESECIFGTPCDGDDGPFTLPQTGTCEWGIQDTDPGYCIKGYRAYAINLVYVGGGDACAWTCVIALYDNDNLLGGPELGYTQRTFDPNDPTGIYDLIFDEADGELHCPDAWPATITVT